jgi:membrane protease YdiL (CAAX protease family)
MVLPPRKGLGVFHASAGGLVKKSKQNDVAPNRARRLAEQDRGPILILLLAPALLTVWVYYGKQATYDQLAPFLPSIWRADVGRTLYEYVAAFVLMLVVPGLAVKWALRQRLRDYGMQLGDVRYGLRCVALALPAALLIAYAASGDAAVQAEYPLAKDAMHHLGWFVTVELFYLVYYVGWEFFFRGFMLFGLEGPFGAILAILVQTIPSTLVHIGKPASEAFAAIGAGLLLGYLAIRTRSILYPLLLHAAVGIGTDAFLILHAGGPR